MKNLQKENVKVFGVAVDDDTQRNFSSGDDGSIFYGLLFIGFGIILLLITLDYLPWSVWHYIWPFWPVLVIYWGLQMLLGGNKYTRFILTILGILMVSTVIAFSIYKVNPAMFNTFPDNILQIFEYLEGVMNK